MIGEWRCMISVYGNSIMARKGDILMKWNDKDACFNSLRSICAMLFHWNNSSKADMLIQSNK